MGSTDSIAYWNVNVPEDQQTVECPDFLTDANEKDRGILATPDSEYAIMGWDECRRIAATNRLGLFQRQPSELRRYKAFVHSLKKKYGSVVAFIMGERLGWTQPIVPRGRPFEFDDDIKILYNDWPYGIDPRIVHIVVWVKFALEEDPKTGDLTDQARKEIDDYVTKTFRCKVPDDQLIWFKNWSSLKSVQAIEHFHVMLYNPDPEFVKEVTNGDVPQCDVF